MTESRAHLIDGKNIAETILKETAAHTQQYIRQEGGPPCLAVILVGDDPASNIYVRNKSIAAKRMGFTSIQENLPLDVPESTIIALIERMNKDQSVNGILLQLPLPKHINASKIIELINPEKDVDGFHPVNIGRLVTGNRDKALIPCTPAGCVVLAKSVHGNDLSGLHTVIVGRSNIVGKPCAQLFLAENCMITITHSYTKNLADITRNADILLSATGQPNMIKGSGIKAGATVIDVGINRLPGNEKNEGKSRITGDIDFESAWKIAGAITPVPGGVGPMTIAMLMQNTLIAAQRQSKHAGHKSA
ncbi:MAG: bifunctional methylenetetrahydrofolate dehydrogenase/methenyltetrahydrofolate cyclohydrolase FolD [Alphaproteobacteria bacterium]|nr:bifunctional methylenetetrahydrofolate dehydrogenase/methenyltetrahydrofolate cyclohydrolase FolD [Alphaproteobacteria bacterium]